ncbi:MAG: LysR family transcriptional regulator, partial [Microcoleus sp. SIO2G3]|nr:LysR family transcriptional regulator [Microcoleus sp. SIO2G3]
GTAAGLYDIGLVTGEVKPSLRNFLEVATVGTDRLQIVVGKPHPWFDRSTVSKEELSETAWVMREPGSGAQQMFEFALQKWGIEIAQLKVALVLTSSEMVKAVVESGVGAAAIPELMVRNELKLHTLRLIKVVNQTDDALDIVQPVLMLKHRQRFQTQIAIAFEQMLI